MALTRLAVCQLRHLFLVSHCATRPAKPEWVDKWAESHPDLAQTFGGDHFFGFADGFPLLVANQASLDDLNARLRAKGVGPVPMDRFRPNIVVQGEWEAFEEDHTAMITTGAVSMAFVKPCTRCITRTRRVTSFGCGRGTT